MYMRRYTFRYVYVEVSIEPTGPLQCVCVVGVVAVAVESERAWGTKVKSRRSNEHKTTCSYIHVYRETVGERVEGEGERTKERH